MKEKIDLEELKEEMFYRIKRVNDILEDSSNEIRWHWEALDIFVRLGGIIERIARKIIDEKKDSIRGLGSAIKELEDGLLIDQMDASFLGAMNFVRIAGAHSMTVVDERRNVLLDGVKDTHTSEEKIKIVITNLILTNKHILNDNAFKTKTNLNVSEFYETKLSEKNIASMVELATEYIKFLVVW